MKKFYGFQNIFILFVSVLLTYCKRGTEKTPIVDDTKQAKTGQELALHQKRIVYQIPEMEDVVCHKGEIYYSVDSMDLEADIYTPAGTAVFGCAGNALAAQSIMQYDNYNIRCAVFYYGLLLTPDQKYFEEINSAQKSYEFYLSDLKQVNDIPSDIPILVTRAGKDKYTVIIKTIDYFLNEAVKSNAKITFINYPEGQHDFDVLDDTENSRIIIRQTVDFLTTHLDVK